MKGQEQLHGRRAARVSLSLTTEPERERQALELFDQAAKRRLACLGEEHSAFFACARALPHFDAVELARQKAVIGYFKSTRIRHRDSSLDRWILSCWTHHGLWALSNDDRRLAMGVWFERIVLRFPERRSFEALSSADAFRMRSVRLRLIGFGAFPSTYPEAPLCLDPLKRLIQPASCWEHLFLPSRGLEPSVSSPPSL